MDSFQRLHAKLNSVSDTQIKILDLLIKVFNSLFFVFLLLVFIMGIQLYIAHKVSASTEQGAGQCQNTNLVQS